MRNRDTIERELEQARDDLEHDLGELKHVIQDKVDIKARARRALERGKYQAVDTLNRGKDSVVDFAQKSRDGVVIAYRRTSDTVRERPALFAGILGGILAATTIVILVQRYRHRPWYQRLWDEWVDAVT